jgi:hypothetical protein
MPQVTLRRTLQQVLHCVSEALAVIEHDEHPEHALADADQAEQLLREHVLPELRRRFTQAQP